MIHALCCSLLLVSIAFAQRPVEGAPALIGTWRVVEFADLDKGGKWQYKYGEHPRGYIVYDATGHVHVQIMKVPPLAPFSEANTDDGKPPSAEHALAAYTAYVAYFGTYTVDEEKHMVTHRVEGSLRVLSDWKAIGWRLATARPGDVCSSVYADFVVSCGAARPDTTFAMVRVMSPVKHSKLLNERKCLVT
jgi:hypothetical protein